MLIQLCHEPQSMMYLLSPHPQGNMTGRGATVSLCMFLDPLLTHAHGKTQHTTS